MHILEVERKAEPREIIGKRVKEEKGLIEVEPGTIVTVKGEPVIIYGMLKKKFSTIRSFLPHVKYSSNRRLTQFMNKAEFEVISTNDVNFGFMPANPVFSNCASPCKFNERWPNWYGELIALGDELAAYYKKANPEKYAGQMKFLKEKIKPWWRIGETPYTQGVINNYNALGYHFDRDNVKNGWSAMAYFCDGVKGGNLVVPSLGLKFMCRDGAYMLFDGQNVIHGVTPIEKTKFRGYRYSLVYYARKSMAGLGTYAEEFEKARQLELRKHKKRVGAE